MDWKKLQNGSDIRGVALEGVPGETVNITPEVTAAIANDGLRLEKTTAAKRGYAKAQLRRSPFMIERFWEVTK